MKKLLLLISLLLATNAWGEGITLKCFGSDSDNAGYVVFHFDEVKNEGWVQLSTTLRRASKLKKYEFTELEITESEIRAKFHIFFSNNPKIVIDRNTGIMDYRSFGDPDRFSGSCSKIDITKKKF